MPVRISLVAVALLACAGIASARLNRSILVPAYKACPTSNCFPPTRASTYTFDSIYLYSSPQPYTGPGKLALMVVVKGLKDAGGNLVTGRLTMPVPPSRITVLSQSVGTFADGSPLTAQPPYVIDVKDGAGRGRFSLPDNTPAGLVANTLGSPVLLDPEGHELATTGTQTKE